MKFGMTDCKPVYKPNELKLKWKKPREGLSRPNVPYQNLIGCLIYIAINSRPYIAHICSVLSQFNSCFAEEHWKCAKRVLHYLKGTASCCLIYEPSEEKLFGFVDSDWGDK